MVFAVVCLLVVLSLVSADPLWVRTHGNPFGGFDEVHAIGADDSGNVVISGLSDMSQDDEEFVTIKYKPNGDTAWLRHFNPGSGRDGATALAVDRSGNVIVTGYLGGSTSQYGDWVTIKYSAVGESLWAATWDLGDEDRPWSVVVDSAGNSYVAGTAGGLNDFDFAVVKYDPAGNEAWVFNYDGGANDMATAVAVSRQGNTYATGFTVRSGIYGDLMTWKLGLGGESLWANTYEGPAGRHDRGQALAVDGLGDVIVTGTSQDANGREDFLTIKYAPNGDTVWTRRYNGAGNQSDQTTGLVLDAAGNAYVAGSSYADNNHYDYTTIKYAPDGTERWIAHYPGISHRAWAQAIALDADANVYVTGYSFDSLNNADVVTVKYDSAGTQRWAERYAGPYGEDEAYVLAVGPDSSVFVGGRTNSDSGGMDYLALRYGVAGAVTETPSAKVRTARRVPTIVRGVLRMAECPSTSSSYLLDACGRNVMELLPGANDVSRLAPGVYFVREQSAFSSQQSGQSAEGGIRLAVTRVIISK
jgi:hypothetical protein